MNQLINPALTIDLWLWPVITGLAIYTILAVIARWLRPYQSLRGLIFPYALGTLTLGFSVGLVDMYARLNTPINDLVEHVLEAILFCTWGFVGLGLAENLLLERWLVRQGVTVPRLVRDIARALAFLIAALITIRLVFEVSLSSIVISSTVLSAVIGLALQDLLKNVFAGIALQIERPFDVGHWIQVNDQTGRVVEMSWRATRIITVDGTYIIYPNAQLAQSELANFTIISPIQAMHVQINIGQEHPPGVVKKVLYAAALAAPDVLPEPKPSIKVIQYADFFIVYDVKFWLTSYDRHPEKRDAVMTSLWYFLQRSGIKLAQPIRNVFTHEINDQTEIIERHVARESAIECLHNIDLFTTLNEQELAILASRVTLKLYGPGEVLVRQGDAGDTFFIIRSGRVRIDVDDNPNDDRAALTVNRLKAGDFFGEMALLTGTPRSATVIAEEDTEVLIVSQEDLASLLQDNPQLPEHLGEILAVRMQMNQAALISQHTDDEPAEALSKPNLVHRIRSLFRLSA